MKVKSYIYNDDLVDLTEVEDENYWEFLTDDEETDSRWLEMSYYRLPSTTDHFAFEIEPEDDGEEYGWE